MRGRWLVTREPGHELVLRDPRNGKKINSFRVPGGELVDDYLEPGAIAASPVRHELAVCQGETVAVYDPRTGKRRWHAQDASPPADDVPEYLVAFDARGEWVLTAGSGRAVRLWRARDGRPGPVLVKAPAGSAWVGFSRSGLVMVADWNGIVRTFDPVTGKQLRRWNTRLEMWGMALAPDGRTLATWHDRSPHIHLWDGRTGKRLLAPIGHEETIKSVEFHGDGQLITRARSGARKRWSLATGKATPLPSLPDQKPWDESSRDGRFVAVNSKKGLELIDRKGGKRRLLVKEVEGDIRGHGFSADGRWLAGLLPSNLPSRESHDRLVVWDTGTGKKRLDREGASHWKFSPDGRMLALRDEESLKVFALERRGGKPLWQLEQETEPNLYLYHWSPRSRYLAVECMDCLQLLDARTGKPLWRSTIDLDSEGLAMAFSPEDRLLATFVAGPMPDCPQATHGKVVTVYSVATGQVLHRFAGHRGGVYGLAFSPSGCSLASCSQDATVILWDLTGRMRRPCRLGAESFERRWKKLASADAAQAEPAFWDIVYCPQAPALVRKAIQRQRTRPPDLLKKCVASLDSDDFETRTRAEAVLLALGPRSTRALKKAMKAAHSLEVRLRIERVLRALRLEALRLSRAVSALEKSGSTEAKTLLKELASGESGGPLTEDAKAALKRLGG
jgi:WD40 repeat protein